jgi:LacI family transcriptional regulator
MPTIKEVAAYAGVSIGTVSNVIAGTQKVSPKRKARVEEAIHALGYHPNIVARSLKSRRTRMLGMVISDITNPFFPEMVRGAEDAAMQRGYLLTMFNTDDSPEREKRIVEILRMRRMDGMLAVVSVVRGEHSHLTMVQESGMPVVCLDRIPEDLKVDAVTVDNAGGVRLAMSHLIEQGYRRIAFLGGRSGMYIAPERLKGYLAAMEAAGLKPIAREGDFRRESGHRLVKELFAGKPYPDALMCANLPMAAGALQALDELGLSTPEDVGMATFDSTDFLRGFRPNLTCVAQPGYQLGFEAATLLIQRLDWDPGAPPKQVELPCQLRIGETTPRRRA